MPRVGIPRVAARVGNSFRETCRERESVDDDSKNLTPKQRSAKKLLVEFPLEFHSGDDDSDDTERDARENLKTQSGAVSGGGKRTRRTNRRNSRNAPSALAEAQVDGAGNAVRRQTGGTTTTVDANAVGGRRDYPVEANVRGRNPRGRGLFGGRSFRDNLPSISLFNLFARGGGIPRDGDGDDDETKQSPRSGKHLWKKVSANKKTLIGEFERTGLSNSYWRKRAGITAFFHGIDRDVNGRRKNRAQALRSAAQKLSKRTKFSQHEDEHFLEERSELEYLSTTETQALCKDRGLRVRDGPDRSLIDSQILKSRLLHYAHGRFGVDWFEPSPFGRNKRGYYAPLLFALSQCVLVSSLTVGTTYGVYTFAENWHSAQNCHKIWNWMNPQCQAADFLRSNAKQAVYRWYYQVGSVIALRAGAWFDALSREAGRLAAEATEGLASQMDVEGIGDGTGASRENRRERR